MPIGNELDDDLLHAFKKERYLRHIDIKIVKSAADLLFLVYL
jgi:hypothetical protein